MMTGSETRMRRRVTGVFIMLLVSLCCAARADDTLETRLETLSGTATFLEGGCAATILVANNLGEDITSWQLAFIQPKLQRVNGALSALSPCSDYSAFETIARFEQYRRCLSRTLGENETDFALGLDLVLRQLQAAENRTKRGVIALANCASFHDG